MNTVTLDPLRAGKLRRDARHNKKPHRIKYHLKLSRRWQKKKNDESKTKADFHYRRFDEKLGRTRYSIQTRRKKLTKETQ